MLIFDLGGGTFDVSLLAIEDGIFEVKATGELTCCLPRAVSMGSYGLQGLTAAGHGGRHNLWVEAAGEPA